MTGNNPFLAVTVGDFNSRLSSWCISDEIMKKLKLII